MDDVKVLVATEVRVYKYRGHFYADASFAKILERYFDNFGKVTLVTRIIKDNTMKNGYVLIDNYCRAFNDVGSLYSFIIKKPSGQLLDHIKKSDLIVLRLPSAISIKFYYLIKKFSKKYLAEVMGCAWDGYWNRGALGKVIAPFMFFKIRSIVKKADYCIYVTQQFLQRRYPNKNMNNTIGVSNVNIDSVGVPRKYDRFNKNDFSMMTAAALNVKYKGQEYVIKAIQKLKRHGINVTYYLAGKGDDARLKKIARRNSVYDNVVFCGMMSRDELADTMRRIDFYIQPSLQEGLPRSLIEAMSCGAVCIGSNVAGIPELLEDDMIFRKRSSRSIVGVIEMLRNCSSCTLKEYSTSNLEKSKMFLNNKLEIERNQFMKSVIEGIRCENH